jgi:flagellar basal body P-ring formation protein FlgA
MIRTLLRSLLPVLALTGLLAASAAAEDGKPALRSHVTVTADVVRIGDLVENAGLVADVPIFRAPDLGTEGAVSTEQIIEAIWPHHLIGIDTRGLAQVVVTRASRTITAQEISERIAQALAGQNGLGAAGDIAIMFDRLPQPLLAEADATGELQVTDLTYNPRNGHFSIVLDLPTSAVLRRWPPRFTGTASATVEAVVMQHAVERGSLLKASDLALERRPRIDGPFIADIAAAAGMAAKNTLRAGQALHEVDLRKPALVQRSDSVTIIYEAPGMVLTLRGEAQESGALGDQISVMNAQSKRVVQGIVSGPGQVTLATVATRLVENAQAASASAAAGAQIQ